MTSSIVDLIDGLGSSIFLIKLRHALGLRLLIVDGQEETAGTGFAQAEA